METIKTKEFKRRLTTSNQTWNCIGIECKQCIISISNSDCYLTNLNYTLLAETFIKKNTLTKDDLILFYHQNSDYNYKNETVKEKQSLIPNFDEKIQAIKTNKNYK